MYEINSPLRTLSDLTINSLLSDNHNISFENIYPKIPLEFILANHSISLDARSAVLKKFVNFIPNDYNIIPKNNNLAVKSNNIQVNQSLSLPVPNQNAIIVKPAHNLDYKIAEATKIVENATALFELIEILENFETGTNLQKHSKNTVFFDGNTNPELLIIGDNTTKEDEDSAKPFSSDSGQIIRSAINWVMPKHEQKTAFVNLMPWRNLSHKIQDDEYRLALPFMIKAIEIMRPKKMIFMGSIVTQYLFNRNESIISMLGTINNYPSNIRDIPTLITISHAHILQSGMGVMRRQFWQDFIAFLHDK